MNFKTQSTLATFLVLMHGRFSRTNMQKNARIWNCETWKDMTKYHFFLNQKLAEMFTCRPVLGIIRLIIFEEYWISFQFIHMCVWPHLAVAYLGLACLGVVWCKMFKNNKQRSSFSRKSRVVIHYFKIKVGVKSLQISKLPF